MKKVLSLIIIYCFSFTNSYAQNILNRTFHRYQWGIETSLGGAGEKREPFMWGISGGLFFRLQNHQFGARLAYYQESSGIFHTYSLSQTINFYYGYLISTKTVNIGFQVGGGHYQNENNYRNNKWHNYNLEGSLYFSLTKVGNGMHIRPFYMWNPQHQYLGINIGGTFGCAWNK